MRNRRTYTHQFRTVMGIESKWIGTALVMMGFILMPHKILGQAAWSNTTFVHREGQQMLDGQNKVIKLNGVNLGGWLMWEGWIWGGGFTAEQDMYKGIQDLVGPAAARNFRDSVYQTYITRADIKKISEQGFNVVRVNLNHTILEDDSIPFVYKQSGWDRIDSILKWCEDYRVYAVLDLHSAPGGQAADFFCEDSDPVHLWQSETLKERTVQLWKAIADRYKNRGIIAGYDLLGEPNVKHDADLLKLYTDIIKSIRTVDPNHMIQLEGNNYAKDFSMFSTLPDPNMCFHFHVYTWFYSNKIEENLAQYTALAQNLNVPVWCGEWGENSIAQLDATLKIINNPKNNISGQAFWTWKKMETALQLPGQVNYPFLVGIQNTSEWDKVSSWINNKNNPKPSKEEAEAGIKSFLASIKLKNCILNTTVRDMLKQTKDTLYADPPASVNIKFPGSLGFTGAAYPGMVSTPETNQYGMYTTSISSTIPLFARLHLGTLQKPIRYSGLFFTASAGIARFSSSTQIAPMPLYSGFLGFTYIKGSTKSTSITGLYAFENAAPTRFLDAPPGVLGLYIHTHQTRSNNTFIVGGGALVFNNQFFMLPIIGYLGKINEEISYLLILPVVAALNYKPNANNRFSWILGPQGNFYKLQGRAFSMADTTVTWQKINLQTGALKNGLSWSRTINKQLEWYTEAGFLLGNSITLTQEQKSLQEKTLPSAYVQIGLTLSLNPNRLENHLKQSNEKNRVNNSFNNQKTNPSIFNMERIFLD